jgi:hypothetical protein
MREFRQVGYNEREEILSVIFSRSVMLKGSTNTIPDYSVWIKDPATYDDSKVVMVGWYEDSQLVGVYINKIFVELAPMGMKVYTRIMFTKPSTQPVEKYDNGFPISTTEFQNANFKEMESRGYYTAYDVHADVPQWRPYAENEHCRMHDYDNTVIGIIPPGKITDNVLFHKYLVGRVYDVPIKIWHRNLPENKR